MGIIFDFLNELDAEIAMEADDITGEAKDGASDLAGEESNEGDIDTNTDDILGTKETADDTTTDNDGDTSGDSESDNENDNDGDGDSTDESSDDGEDSGMGDDDSLGDSGKDEEDPFINDRKKKLRNQFIHLFDILDDSIKLVSSHVPNVTDAETIRALNNVSDNLTQCKEQVYSILTDGYQKAEYHDLLKKYVAVNRIYDLCIKIMERYFESYRPENEKENKKK